MTDRKMDDFSDIVIASDFDGTLRDDNAQIPEKNITAIERFKKKHGTFIVASGRARFVLDAIEPKVKDLVNAPCIYSNGGYLYDYKNGKKLNEKFVNENIVRDILYTSRSIVHDAGIRIERGNENLTPEKNEEIERQIAKGYMENARIYTFDTVPVDKISKITISVPEDRILQLKNAIEEKFSEFVDVYISWKTLIDIHSKNVSKGNMLKQIKDEYISAGKNVKVFAVGDYENDIDLLKNADYACCPANSLKCVKDICSIHLCSNNEGAIADLIEKIENGLVI